MSKEDRDRAPDTAYKIYSTPGRPLTDNSIVQGIEEFLGHLEKVVPMPLIRYKTSDVAQMTGRSLITVRKAAREMRLGYSDGNMRVLSSNDVRAIVQHFKKIDEQHKKPDVTEREVYRTWWAFQEVALIKETMLKLGRDVQRFHTLLHDIMNKNAEWREEMLQANRALQRRIDEIGGQEDEKVDSDGDDSIGLRSPPENSPHGQTRRDSRVLPRHGPAAIPDNPGDD